MAAMSALSREHGRMTAAGVRRLGNSEAVEALRGRAAALLDYAGRVPFRLAPDVHSQLVQLEVELH